MAFWALFCLLREKRWLYRLDCLDARVVRYGAFLPEEQCRDIGRDGCKSGVGMVVGESGVEGRVVGEVCKQG